MQRLSDILVEDGSSYSANTLSRMVNIGLAGQNGFSPSWANIHANTHSVRRQLVAVLVDAPKGFGYLEDSDMIILALRQMVETLAKTIEGLNAELKVDTAETNNGGGGEVWEDPTNVTRERSSVTFGWTDLEGRPIQELLKLWIRFLIADPDSKTPMITSLTDSPDDLLADMRGMTVLFFEPDATFKYVSKAWLGTNMYPKQSGPEEGKRDLTQGGELLELAIPFTGVYSSTMGVKQFAQAYLDAINKQDANPALAAAFTDAIDADVEAVGGGYSEGVTNLANNIVTRV